jgi:hypothetical protein
MYKASDFKIRCSAISDIMTGLSGKTKAQKISDVKSEIRTEQTKLTTLTEGSKSHDNKKAKIEKLQAELSELEKLPDIPPLTQTTITYLENWCKERIYQQRKNIVTAEMYKGNALEKDAIDYISLDIWGVFGAEKNTQRFTSEYIEGEPDVILANSVEDIKNSYSFSTFPYFAKQLPDSKYDWQILGYQYLLQQSGKDIQKGGVNYVLMPKPMELLQMEAYRIAKFTYSEDTIDFQDKLADVLFQLDKDNEVIKELPIKYRAKRFEVLYNQDRINLVIERVKQCRQYIEQHLIV